MYIEMVDETGKVPVKMQEQIIELLQFAAKKIGKQNKEMAVTFVDNARVHEVNLEY